MQTKGSMDAEGKRSNTYIFRALYWVLGLILMVGMGGVWVILSSNRGHHGRNNTEVTRSGYDVVGAVRDGGAVQDGVTAQVGGEAESEYGGSALGGASVKSQGGSAMRGGGAESGYGGSALGGASVKSQGGSAMRGGGAESGYGGSALGGASVKGQGGSAMRNGGAAQGEVDIYFLTGRNSKSSSGVGFTTVPVEFCSKAMELQPEVIEAFGKMRTAAAGAGIALTIISGRRNYEQQKVIWVNKWNKLQSRGIHGVDAVEHILRYSSMPGSSRHHWGTDIDINSLEPAYFTTAKGAKELAWLRANAHNYGFAEVYSPRTTGRSTGYQPEPWHWSYMPLASSYLSQYKQKIGYTLFGIPDSKNSDSVMVFSGSQFAKTVKIIENYVGGVNDPGTWKKP